MLQDTLRSFMMRKKTSLQTDGAQDVTTIAINSAQIKIQRELDFEWLKRTVYFETNAKGYGDIQTAFDYHTDEPTRVKRIVKAFGNREPSITNNSKVDYISLTTSADWDTHCHDRTTPTLIHEGTLLKMRPSNPSKPIYALAVKWLADLREPTDTNFLLEYGRDYLIYHALLELNFYIKSDQAFEVNTRLMSEARKTLFDWNKSLLSPTETEVR